MQLDLMTVGPFSEVRESTMQGYNSLDKFSLILRCHVGHHSGVGSFTLLSDANVGNYVSIASRVSIGAFNHPRNWLSVNEFQYKDTTRIWGVSYPWIDQHEPKLQRLRTTIGSDVWICDNAVVVAGSNIGVGCIIAAGAVAKGNYPPYSVLAGVPAKVKTKRFEEKIIERLLKSEWWTLNPEQIHSLSMGRIDFSDVEGFLSLIEAASSVKKSSPKEI